jgi:uncharacterized protein YkwD
MKSAFSFFSLLSIIILFSFNGTSTTSLRDDVLKVTNEFRKSKNIAALEMNEEMNAVAQKHSQNMANGKVSFGHVGFAQRTDEIKKKMKNCGAFAENVAFGVSTAKEAIELWKSSDGHRKNLLGKYRYIGIGIATSKTNGQTYFTQIFAE